MRRNVALNQLTSNVVVSELNWFVLLGCSFHLDRCREVSSCEPGGSLYLITSPDRT